LIQRETHTYKLSPLSTSPPPTLQLKKLKTLFNYFFNSLEILFGKDFYLIKPSPLRTRPVKQKKKEKKTQLMASDESQA
jgi:hypothetical protein